MIVEIGNFPCLFSPHRCAATDTHGAEAREKSCISPTSTSNQAQILGLFQEIIAKPGIGDADDVQGAIAGGLAFDVNHPMFRSQVLGIHAGGGNAGAGSQAGDNP